MNGSRRDFVRAAGGFGLLGALLSAGMLRPEEVRAADWNSAAFDGKKLDEVIRALGGAGTRESADIAMNAPEIAENGAVVPIQIVSACRDPGHRHRHRKESTAPGGVLRDSRGYARGHPDARQDGGDLQRVCAGEGRRRVLLRIQGDQDHRGRLWSPKITYSTRPYPSAGSAYELELYLAVSNCEGLARGLYHMTLAATRWWRSGSPHSSSMRFRRQPSLPWTHQVRRRF